MKDDKDFNVTQGFETWNVAKGYSLAKILRWLIELDRLEIISIYGTEDINEVLPMPFKIERRIEAIKRYADVLRMIISNADPFIKKDDVTEWKKLKERKNMLIDKNMISKKKTDAGTKTVEIEITDNFKMALNKLREVKESVTKILNNANLIFSASSEFSIEDFEKDVIEAG